MQACSRGFAAAPRQGLGRSYNPEHENEDIFCSG